MGAHNKFTLPLASLFIRVPVISLAPAAAYYIEAPLSYVTWCFCISVVSYSLDLLLIKQLKFEVDLDFIQALHDKKAQKGKRIAHARKASTAHKDGHNMVEMTSHHGHHGHHDSYHSGHDSHHSGHQDSHHSGHHDSHHGNHRGHGSHGRGHSSHGGHHSGHHDDHHRGRHHDSHSNHHRDHHSPHHSNKRSPHHG